MAKPKHQLPVVDAAMRVVPRQYVADYKEIAAVLPRAQRFMLTDEASVHLGHIIAAAEDLILDNHMFAIPPFDTVYIELSCKLLYEAAGKRTSEDMIRWKDKPADDWVGYLIDRGRIWTFSRDTEGSCGMGPWRFEDSLGHASFWPPIPSFPEVDALGSEWGRLAVLLGSGMHKLTSGETKVGLLQRFTIHPAFQREDGTVPQLYFDDWSSYQCSMGDLRNILAALVILNAPQNIRTTAQPPRHFLYKGRRTTYAAHRIVTIELGKTTDMRRLFNHPSGIHQRRHPVRGHWMHSRLADGCVHDWPAVPEGEADGSPRWRCSKCGGLRTWRKQHERGDAALGYVTHEYRIT